MPLPKGAELTKRTPGDGGSERDPAERYAVDAAAAVIAAFFYRAMTADGWMKEGTLMETALFFRKGKLMVGVLIGRGGGAFTLMGS